MRTPSRLRILLIVSLVISFTNNVSARDTTSLAQPEIKPGAGEAGPNTLSVVYADPRNVPAYVPPPTNFNSNAPRRMDAIQITINYNPTSCGANVTAWPANAQTAFAYAASVWSWVLTGTQTIVVDACWRTNLAANILGSASSGSYRNFSGAPLANTFYPTPLANQLADADLNGSTADIQARFNANQVWYFGLDGNVPPNQYDLVTIVLHELGHGVGFAGGMNWDNGSSGDGTECDGTAGHGCWGTDPLIYDRFTRTTTQTLMSLGNNSAALGTALTSDDVYFDGFNANFANGGNWPRLHAPGGWIGGTSYVHLREGTFMTGTLNALMTPLFAAQEAIHYPGEIALAMLRDMGWHVPDLASTYVNGNWTGFEDGTFAHPFNTVVEGTGAVINGGSVWIQGGVSYLETVAVSRPMTLRAVNGSAIIGAP